MPELKNVPALNFAFIRGRVEQSEAVRMLAIMLMHKNVVNPMDPIDDAEKAIVNVLGSIIENCMNVEKGLQHQCEVNQKFDA
jgi:hypothetical protein